LCQEKSGNHARDVRMEDVGISFCAKKFKNLFLMAGNKTRDLPVDPT
jgi:hypothetical protein